VLLADVHVARVDAVFREQPGALGIFFGFFSPISR
jgi:hypothetical protein